ncbi:restriction endonuclease subunit S [Neiella sp. HB171785]|uniref:Restriction endonuclease subunit S n=1 Tax=Neiella litorisoli TaxID=2771431 RepID=A0A8J6QI76_9GAMM|nr:restriction endonuclease subunit S [Neiella litorisoli]MBD1388977.1 restriction endonuclease subunit S [Neiella litorisoli]
MSVDTLRESFHINKISSQDLGDFLTAQTYRPEITEVKNHILTLVSEPMQNVCDRAIRQGKSPKYATAGLTCIKPKNTREMIVSIDDVDYIDESTYEEVKNQELQYGDVVVTRSGSGTIGRASMYSYDEPAFTNDHLFIIRPSKADGHYICAYLKSYQGERLLESGISGSTGQLNLSNEHLKSLPLYTPILSVQKYIGNKIRHAEQLRAWAQASITSLDFKFKEMYRPISAYEAHKKNSYNLNPQQLFEVLTPASYPPHIEKYFKDNPFVTLGSICTDIYIGKTLAEKECGVLQATSRSCSGLFFKQPMNRVENNQNVKSLKQKDIVLTNAAHDKNYIGKDVTFNHSDKYILPSAKVLVVRVSSTKIPTSYVHSYLMTEAGYTQWQAVVRGISAGIHPSDVSRIRIPLPLDEALLAEISEEVDSQYINAGYAKEYARLLTLSAKLLVEALIQGTIDEEKLVIVQSALESGDYSLDKELLAQLTETGFNNDAEPLFEDLDKLYDLLEQSKDYLEAEA